MKANLDAVVSFQHVLKICLGLRTTAVDSPWSIQVSLLSNQTCLSYGSDDSHEVQLSLLSTRVVQV